MTLRRTACALALLLPAAAMAQEREVTGALTYLQRIALPEDALLLVELAGPEGDVLAEARRPTEGAQVPLPFSVAGPAGTALTLRGGLILGGAPIWVTEPVAIEAGAEPAGLGEVRLSQYRPLGFPLRFRCGETEVEIGFSGEVARMRVGGSYHDLTPEVTASGAKFSNPADPGTFAWSKGNEMTVSLRGAELPACAPLLPGAAPFRARGIEPGWLAEIADGMLTLTRMDAGPVGAALPEPEPAEGGRRYALAEGFALTLADRLCHDAATGMPHPAAAVLEIDGGRFEGCGGAPADLIAGVPWRVTEIEGAALPEAAEVTLAFTASGHVSGKSACNRYGGRYVLTGEGLSFGPAAATMMACAPELMEAEHAFHAMLGKVDRFDIGSEGELILIGGDAPLASARF